MRATPSFSPNSGPRTVIFAAGEIGDQQGVFVIGMGGDEEDAAHFAEAAEVLLDGGGRRGIRD